MRKVFITGASRGIGKAAAAMFTERGYKVSSPGRDILDLSDPESVKTFIKENDCQADILINNAGINPLIALEDISYEDFLKVFNINLFSAAMLVKAFAPHMKKNNYGRILNISSVWSVVSKPKRMVYAASKAAINSITQTMALELGGYGILVNALAPGFVNTELTKQNNGPAEIDLLEKSIPLNRLAQPEEIAEAIFFLASDKNTFITGQTIQIDGGYTCR